MLEGTNNLMYTGFYTIIPFVILLASMFITMCYRSIRVAMAMSALFCLLLTIWTHNNGGRETSPITMIQDLSFYSVYISLSMLVSWLTLTYVTVYEAKRNFYMTELTLD